VILSDKFGRPITDLRISITDRCNYRCVYCRTGNEGALYGELPFSDYLRMTRIFAALGIKKIRLTGGEPLLRNGVIDFVRELAKLRSADGEELDLAITTNGHLLSDMALPLKDAGLNRITVSMDAVDPDRFARITRVPNGYDHVLAGIRASRRAGLWPVKVNCVLMRGFNEDQIIPFGMFAREEGVIVRFIEFMPLEEDRTWSPAIVVTLDEIVERMAEYRPLVEIPHARSETARRYHFDDGIGEIGIIAPVSHPFCGHCSPHSHYLRRQNPHLPVFGVGPRSARTYAPRAPRTKNWWSSFAAWCRGKKSATTSENRILCPRRGLWCTSGDSGSHVWNQGCTHGMCSNQLCSSRVVKSLTLLFSSARLTTEPQPDL
jgi:GTP 3',8-cyclase